MQTLVRQCEYIAVCGVYGIIVGNAMLSDSAFFFQENFDM